MPLPTTPRMTTARKQKRAKKKKERQKSVRRQREALKASVGKPSLRGELDQLRELQESRLRVIANTIGTIWKNQRELDAAHHKVDTQQFVLARLLISAVNDILIRIGSEDLISQETVARCFLEWDEFSKRPDYKDLLIEWMMGKPLSELPPPPEVKEEEQPKEAPAESEDPQEFGGDYGEGQSSSNKHETVAEEPSENSGTGEENEMPEGQDADSAVSAEG